MIMGAGKTTVVSPLALMLADGRACHTGVPCPLLEMTRSEMRGKFLTSFANVFTR